MFKFLFKKIYFIEVYLICSVVLRMPLFYICCTVFPTLLIKEAVFSLLYILVGFGVN